MDALMMAALGGKERTYNELLILAKSAGFAGIRKECLACSFWVMEFYNLEESKPTKTAMSPNTKLTKDEKDESVDSRKPLTSIKKGVLDGGPTSFGVNAAANISNV
ncbi:hypothetical protein Tco_1220753 [Tanacetum coccineum]